MTVIDTNTKLFSYGKSSDRFVLVSKSFFKTILKKSNYLTKSDLLKSAKQGKLDVKNSKTVDAFAFVNSL